MSTNLPPKVANDMFKGERDKDKQSERDADRKDEQPESGKHKLERAAEQNDRRSRD